MAKKRVVTKVVVTVELTVPHGKAPGHVLQWVTKVLQQRIERPAEDDRVTPFDLRTALTKKETTYG